MLLIIETVDFYPVPSRPGPAVCKNVFVYVTETEDESMFVCARGGEYGRQGSGPRQFQAFIFLIHKRQALCGVVFFPPPCFFFSFFFHLPLPRQGNRGGIIASEVQKYRLAIWREDERKTRARGRRGMEGEREQGQAKGKESQTGSFTAGTGTERLRHCDKRQSKCICKCKRLLSLPEQPCSFSSPL